MLTIETPKMKTIMSIEVNTIGFTQKSAEKFFKLIKLSGSKRVVDVRLNNVSQLAGFAKRNDLKFFLKEMLDVDLGAIFMPQ